MIFLLDTFHQKCNLKVFLSELSRGGSIPFSILDRDGDWPSDMLWSALTFLVNIGWATEALQVSRSIGDIYLKKAKYNREPLYAKFRLREPFKKPILSSEPSISVHPLQPHDQFLIFASDGLWEHLSNQEAVDIVNDGPRSGGAKRLVKAALQEAAKKREMRYSDLKKIDRGVRRYFHDDITVIVVFLDSNLLSRASSMSSSPTLSLRGGGITVSPNSLAPCATPAD